MKTLQPCLTSCVQGMSHYRLGLIPAHINNSQLQGNSWEPLATTEDGTVLQQWRRNKPLSIKIGKNLKNCWKKYLLYFCLFWLTDFLVSFVNVCLAILNISFIFALSYHPLPSSHSFSLIHFLPLYSYAVYYWPNNAEGQLPWTFIPFCGYMVILRRRSVVRLRRVAGSHWTLTFSCSSSRCCIPNVLPWRHSGATPLFSHDQSLVRNSGLTLCWTWREFELVLSYVVI